MPDTDDMQPALSQPVESPKKPVRRRTAPSRKPRIAEVSIEPDAQKASVKKPPPIMPQENPPKTPAVSPEPAAATPIKEIAEPQVAEPAAIPAANSAPAPT